MDRENILIQGTTGVNKYLTWYITCTLSQLARMEYWFSLCSHTIWHVSRAGSSYSVTEVLSHSVQQPLKHNYDRSVFLGQLRMSFLPLRWCARGICVFLYEPGFLRDHVGDAANDGVGDTKLLVDQLIGLGLVPGRGREQQNSSSSPSSIIL